MILSLPFIWKRSMSKLGKSNSLSHHFRKTITSSLVHSLGSGGRPAGSCAFVSPRGEGGGGAQGRGYLHSSSVGLNGSGNRSILGPEGNCRLTTFILTICKKYKKFVNLLSMQVINLRLISQINDIRVPLDTRWRYRIASLSYGKLINLCSITWLVFGPAGT